MKLIVIGGGAAGMMCAISAAEQGADVTLLEKNEKLGKKLYITGKGRCNITNCTDFDDYMNNIVSNKKFMISALREFDCNKCMAFFEGAGLPLKIERGNRVFPVSDKSNDVIKALERRLKSLDVKIILQQDVRDLVIENNKIISVVTDDKKYDCDAVAVCTGGKSYPLTGSTGDGYKWAEKLGHKIVPTYPALCGFITENAIKYNGHIVKTASLPRLQGLSLKNVSAKILEKTSKKILFEEFGEMLFTERGVSGPIILTLSSKIARLQAKNLLLQIDLKPALHDKQLDDRFLRDFSSMKNKMVKNSLDALLPKSLIPYIIKISDIPPEKEINSLTKEERQRLVGIFKNLLFEIKGSESFDSAIITSGGVDVKEINPKNMQSKIVPNLYFAGEVLDVDALTGGFNLQIAFATGYALGKHINQNQNKE